MRLKVFRNQQMKVSHRMKNDLVVVVPAVHNKTISSVSEKNGKCGVFFLSKRRYLSLVTHFSVLIRHLSVQQTMLMNDWRNHVEKWLALSLSLSFSPVFHL